MNEGEIQKYLDQGFVQQYGVLHAPWTNARGKVICQSPVWERERNLYLRVRKGEKISGSLTAAEHFKNYTNAVCARHPRPEEPVFEWNPNAERILVESFNYRFLSTEGHTSSSKTRTMAAMGVFNFLASPKNTAILLTSTTLKDAKHRIWADVEMMWQLAGEFFQSWYHHAGIQTYNKWEESLPGELVSSQGFIRYREGDKRNDKFGLMLISGDKTKVTEGVGKIRGFKATHMYVMLDELAAMPKPVIKAVETNLAGNMQCRVISGQNPENHFDAGGDFSTPKDGWNAINVEDEFWITTRGACLHFDGKKSPNVLAKKNLYPGLLTYEGYEDARIRLGEDSPEFWQQYRGFRCPNGSSENIFCSAEILKYDGEKQAIWGSEGYQMCGGFDPSFQHGGDRAVLVPAKVGRLATGLMGIEFQEPVILDHGLDVKSKDSKSEQVNSRLIAKCHELGIDRKNLAIDYTGAGQGSADLITRDWGTGFLKVNFGGKASEIVVSAVDSRKGFERFSNMVSELWYIGRDLLRAGQLRGMGKEMCVELCQRQYRFHAGRIEVEPKADMKARIGKSPDIGDAGVLCLYVARARLGLQSGFKAANTKRVEPKTFLDQFFESNPLPKRKRTPRSMGWEPLESEAGTVRW